MNTFAVVLISTSCFQGWKWSSHDPTMRGGVTTLHRQRLHAVMWVPKANIIGIQCIASAFNLGWYPMLLTSILIRPYQNQLTFSCQDANLLRRVLSEQLYGDNKDDCRPCFMKCYSGNRQDQQSHTPGKDNIPY
eukprot:1206911-Amphidinium_carterae.1